jgi:hypothetical protein
MKAWLYRKTEHGHVNEMDVTFLPPSTSITANENFVGTIEVEEPGKEKEATPIWQETKAGCVTTVVTGTHKQIYDYALKTKSRVSFPELEVVKDGDYKFNRFFNLKWFDNCIVFPHDNEDVVGILTRIVEPAPKKTVTREAHVDIRSHETPRGGKWVDGIVTIPSAAKNIKCTYEVSE